MSSKLEMNVVVRKKTLSDSFETLNAVFLFVNFMLNDGHYRIDELPSNAAAAYYAAIYLWEVQNGGHYQFLENQAANFGIAASFARAGLLTARADKYSEIFNRFENLLSQQPDDSELDQTSFSALDNDFYELDIHNNPLTDRLAIWIRNWPNLLRVPDDTIAEHMEELKNANGSLKDRQVAAQIKRFEHCLTDPLFAGISIAVRSIEPPEYLVRILGGRYLEIDGHQRLVWSLETNSGDRAAILHDEKISIYHQPFQGRDRDVNLPSQRHLGTATQAIIKHMIDRAQAIGSAAAASLLIRRAMGHTVQPNVVHAFNKASGDAEYLLTCADASFILKRIENGFILISREVGEVIGPATDEEVREHAERYSD